MGFTFVFGLLLLVLAVIGFFFGANAQKVCQSLEAPDYLAFTNVSMVGGEWREGVEGESGRREWKERIEGQSGGAEWRGRGKH